MKIKFILILLMIIHVSSDDKISSSMKDSIITIINKGERIKGDLSIENKKGISFKFKDEKKQKAINNFKEYAEHLFVFEENKDEIFFVDYRLISECKFRNDNNFLNFTINKRENKMNFISIVTNSNSNSDEKIQQDELKDSLELQIDFKNYSQVFYNQITETCKQRKNEIKNLKDTLYDYVIKQKELKSKINSINNSKNEKNKIKNKIDSIIQSSSRLIKEKESLKEISSDQLNHLKTLRENSLVLKNKQIEEQKFSQNKLEKVVKKLDEKKNIALIKTQSFYNLEKEIKSLSEEENNTKNEILNLQNNMLQSKGIVDQVKDRKSIIEMELKQLKENTFYEESDKQKLLKEVELSKQKIGELKNNIKAALEAKNTIDLLNKTTYEEIKEIDKKINLLLEERTKKVESIKKNTENIKSQNLIINHSNIETSELNFKITLIQSEISKKENIFKEFREKSDFLTKQLNDIGNKYKEYSDYLKSSNQKIISFKEKIGNFTKEINIKNKKLSESSSQLQQLANETNNLESSKSKLELEHQKLVSNLKNNELQINNLDYEIRRLSTPHFLSFSKINKNKENEKINSSTLEYDQEKNKIQNDINDLNSQLEEIKNEENKLKLSYNTFTENNLQKEIPVSNLIIDLINEDIANSYSNDLNKIKNLIEMIKN